MKIYILNIFLLNIFVLTSAMIFPVFAGADEEYVPNEVVIKLRSPLYLRQIAKKYKLSPAPLEQFGSRPIYRMRILDGTDALQRAAQLQADNFNRVEFAELNFQIEAPEARGDSWSIGGSAPQYVNQWFREPLRIDQAHQQTQGAGIKIAVLDTGIDANHPAFTGRLIQGYDFVDDDNNPGEEGVFGTNPGFGHGTHVAGLIALVAPQSQIIPVRVLDENGVGNIWVLAEGLKFAADPDGNPLTNDGADVINLSLATRRQTDLLANIIGEIGCSDDDDDDLEFGDDENNCQIPGQKGIIVVAGSGNRNSDIQEFPAAENLQGLISVAASNQQDQLAAFSNFGSWVHIAAPGQSILSTIPGGNYGTWNGTSMSTPLVSGAAALIRSQNNDWTAFQTVERILVSSVKIEGTNLPLIRLDVAGCVGQ